MQLLGTLVLLVFVTNCIVGSQAESCRKVFLVADGHDYHSYSYIDNQGYLAGFNHDLLKLVCGAANIDCRLVWDKYTNCIDSQAGQHNYGGQGLHGRWYDACTGWYTTVGRTQIFDFSKPFAKGALTHFWVKKGDTSFDVNDVTGKKIGFLDGWASDEKCLARQTIQGVPIPVEQVIHVQTTEELKNAIVNGEVDAGFAAFTDLEIYIDSGELDRLEASHKCMVAGNAMMTRKDSDFNSYFNMGLEKVIASGEFHKLCEAAKTKHPQGFIDCID